VVANSAGIAVNALTLAEFFLDATLFPLAEVGGAVVAVIAKPHILAFDKESFVHITITIVVNAVAALCCGNRGITVAQPLLQADPLAGADSKLVFPLAGRPQS
jgi:hypothetical protein